MRCSLASVRSYSGCSSKGIRIWRRWTCARWATTGSIKVTGDSLMLDGGIPAHMVNGQGRWRLHASDPPEIVYKYRQSDLETKLKTSDL